MAQGRKASPEKVAEYRRLRREGFSRAESCRRVGMSTTWGYEQDKSLPADHTEAREKLRRAADAGGSGPIPYEQLSDQARRAFDDFEFFGRRYFGRIYRPWQIETAHAVIEELGTRERSYVVENCPPGAGKTTLAHDIGCWVTVRDRRIRACMGSRKENNARRMVKRIRRTLEATVPIRPPTRDLERGFAVEPESCLAWDFGLFRPEVVDTWRQDEFIVAQVDDVQIVEKEPTWSAYGMDSGVLSNRFDLVIWDDVVDKKTLRTLDQIEEQRRWWDEEAVTRLEPGGVVWLIGQRMASNDLYRYCLDKRIDPIDMDALPEPEDDDMGAVVEDDDRPRMYRHIKFKAHYQENCQGADTHTRDAPAYPEGCLLDPYRLTWRDLASIKSTNPDAFLVQYQQEDADPSSVLIPKVWIWGGKDPEDGALRPGCVDTDRGICSPLPDGLVGAKTSIATVDPSGTNRWAVQWWVTVHTESHPIAFLMDLEGKRMQANELLDWNANSRSFYGLMDEWQTRSEQVGYPISHWIVEDNAAQRYLLVYDHVRRWQAARRVSIVPHTTGPQHYKKIDNERGPAILRDWFKHGRIRLPGKQGSTSRARIKTLKLESELTKWPNGTTDDQVMAAWFHFLHLPRIHRPGIESPRMWRPSWMTDTPAGMAS